MKKINHCLAILAISFFFPSLVFANSYSKEYLEEDLNVCYPQAEKIIEKIVINDLQERNLGFNSVVLLGFLPHSNDGSQSALAYYAYYSINAAEDVGVLTSEVILDINRIFMDLEVELNEGGCKLTYKSHEYERNYIYTVRPPRRFY